MRMYKMYVSNGFMESMRVSLSGTPEDKERLRREAMSNALRRKDKFRELFVSKYGDDTWRTIDRVMYGKFQNQFWICANHTIDNIWMAYWSSNPCNDYDDSEIGISFRNGRFVYEHVTPTGGYGDIVTTIRFDLTPAEVEEFVRIKPTPSRFIFDT